MTNEYHEIGSVYKNLDEEQNILRALLHKAYGSPLLQELS